MTHHDKTHQVSVDTIPNPSPTELASLPREIGFVPTMNPAPKRLTQDQIAFYNREGYLMPFEGLDEQEIREHRAFFDGVLAAFLDLGRDSYSINTAHLRFARIYDLMHHPRLLAPILDLLGDNVVAWGAHFFCKMPHDGKIVPWHQDFTYWPLSPTRTVTLWLALDDAFPENANMQFIPQSHRHGLLNYEQALRAEVVLDLEVPQALSYGSPPVDVTLKAGQFSLHSDLLLHGSQANHSPYRRCGLTMRYASAEVKTWFDWHKKGILVAGRDASNHWLNAPRPLH